MNSAHSTEKITDKCLEIYSRKPSLAYVGRYLDRLLPDDTELNFTIYEEYFKPAVRKIYFAGLTIESFLEKAISGYRANGHPSSALISIWIELDELPFTGDEYADFVELFEDSLAKEANPPTAEAWDDLNEWLGK